MVRGEVTVYAGESTEITMRSGFLFVSFTGARYEHMYYINYWYGSVTPISAEFPNYIEVAHEAMSQVTKITNKTNATQNVAFLVIA